MAKKIKNLGIRVLAILCLLVGFITILTPIPTGIFLLAIGIALFLMTSKTAIIYVRKIRRKFPKVDNLLHKAEYQLPEKLAKTLRRTSVRIKSTANSAGHGLKSMRKSHASQK